MLYPSTRGLDLCFATTLMTSNPTVYNDARLPLLPVPGAISEMPHLASTLPENCSSP